MRDHIHEAISNPGHVVKDKARPSCLKSEIKSDMVPRKAFRPRCPAREVQKDPGTGQVVKKEVNMLTDLPIMKIAEQRIREAQERGEFDDLPGRGQPLKLEDDSNVPEDLRLAYKILKNADCLPPELEAKKEIRQMEDLLENVPDEKERYKLIKKINYQIMKLNTMGKKSPLLEEKEIYFKKVVDKIGKK